MNGKAKLVAGAFIGGMALKKAWDIGDKIGRTFVYHKSSGVIEGEATRLLRKFTLECTSRGIVIGCVCSIAGALIGNGLDELTRE